MTDLTVQCDIGFVGAGVMGKNLILNLADHGYRVAAFDLDHKKLESVIQQDLAEKVQVSRQTINSIEAGKYVPSTVLALKIARIFGVGLEEIFELEEGD